MKRAFLAVIIALLGANAKASFLDQSQEQLDPTLFVICQEWRIAQTFTAGISGQLERIDLCLENIFGDPLLTPGAEPAGLYPTTVSIVDVIEGVPSGAVLGTVYAENLIVGWNIVDYLSEAVFLTAGTQYGIVLYNSDIARYEGISTQWDAAYTDIYSGGAAWSYTNGQWTQTVTPPGNLPVETFYDKDAAFRTHMTPEPSALLILGVGCLRLRIKNFRKF